MTHARGNASAGGKPNNRSYTNDSVAMLTGLGDPDSALSLELPYKDENIYRTVCSFVSTSILAGAREDANDPSNATLA
jgi:hypothetical protein